MRQEIYTTKYTLTTVKVRIDVARNKEFTFDILTIPVCELLPRADLPYLGLPAATELAKRRQVPTLLKVKVRIQRTKQGITARHLELSLHTTYPTVPKRTHQYGSNTAALSTGLDNVS